MCQNFLRTSFSMGFVSALLQSRRREGENSIKTLNSIAGNFPLSYAKLLGGSIYGKRETFFAATEGADGEMRHGTFLH